MAITFAYRSDQLAPRYVSAVTTYAPMAQGADTVPALVSGSGDTGVIGSTILDIDKQTQSYRTYRFLGLGNIPLMTGGFSILTRVIPRYTGSPGAANLGGIWTFYSFSNLPWAYLTHNTNGTFNLRILTHQSGNMINVTTTATWSATSGTAADICITWDGTTSANTVGFWVDGTEIETATASAVSDYTVNNGRFGEILPCCAIPLGNDGDHDLNELVLWDSEIDPSSGGLDLSGSSRTSFVEVEENDQIPSGGGGGSTILGGLGLKK